jgi:uncharacterized membrane protein
VRKLAIALWTAQVLAAVVMFVAAVIEIESIMGTGPALSIIGLMLAAVTWRLNSWEPMAFGVSGPLVCAVGALLIAVNHWNPDKAAGPIPMLFAAYLLAATPLAYLSLRAIWRWQMIMLPQQRRTWQFSMKALMIWMTAVCVLAALGPFVARRLDENPLQGEGYIFVTFATGAIILSGAVLWRYFAKRRSSDRREGFNRADG